MPGKYRILDNGQGEPNYSEVEQGTGFANADKKLRKAKTAYLTKTGSAKSAIRAAENQEITARATQRRYSEMKRGVRDEIRSNSRIKKSKK